MNLSEKEIEEMCKDALHEALKDRFAKIAANELTLGADEGEAEFRKMFANLKLAYNQITRIIPEFFPPKWG